MFSLERTNDSDPAPIIVSPIPVPDSSRVDRSRSESTGTVRFNVTACDRYFISLCVFGSFTLSVHFVNMSLFRKPTTPDDLNSNRFQPAPNVSGPLRTTPGDFGQYRTAPDNVGPTYLPGSIPKLAESDRNFANFTHHQCKQRKSKLSFIVLCLCRTHSPSAVGEQDGTIAATWSGAVLSALRRLLDTHVLEVDLAYPNGASVSRAYGEGTHFGALLIAPLYCNPFPFLPRCRTSPAPPADDTDDDLRRDRVRHVHHPDRVPVPDRAQRQSVPDGEAGPAARLDERPQTGKLAL